MDRSGSAPARRFTVVDAGPAPARPPAVDPPPRFDEAAFVESAIELLVQSAEEHRLAGRSRLAARLRHLAEDLRES